ELVSISVLVPAPEQRMPCENCKRTASTQRHFPDRFDLATAQANERKFGVVVEPNVLFGFNIQCVAITDRVQAIARLELMQLVPGSIPSNQSRGTDRTLPTVVAEYAFVKITRPDHPTARCLHRLNAVAEQHFPSEPSAARVYAPVLLEVVGPFVIGAGTNKQ